MASRLKPMLKSRSIFLLLCFAAANAKLLSQTPVTSPPVLASQTAAGASLAPQLSANGRYVLFLSHAKNLTTNHLTGMALNLFRRDLVAKETILISTDLSGNAGGDENSPFYSISADG